MVSDSARPLAPADGAAAWQQLADSDADALVSQTPEWIEVLCRSGYEDASRAYEAPDGSVMVLPLVRRLGSLPRAVAPLASLPVAWGVGGLLAQRRPGPAELAAVLDDLSRLPAMRVTLRPNPLHARAWAQAARGRSLLIAPRRAHVLELRGGPAAIWERRFTPAARRAVQRAEATGLEVRAGSTPELLGHFRRLYEHAVRRSAELRHEPQALAMLRAVRRDPPAKFLHVAEALPDRLRVWVAFRGELPVAGLLALLGGNASVLRNAGDTGPAGRRRALELLHWHAIRDACAAGCRSYHLGESGTTWASGELRESLGARPVPCAAYCIERLPLQRSHTAARAALQRAIGGRGVG